MNNPKDIKKEFNETLARIVEDAFAAGNIITKNEIYTYFKDLITDEKMYDFIYKYLSDKKITVAGYTPENSSAYKIVKESEQSLNFYKMYLDEVNIATQNSPDKILEVFHSLIAGSSNAANKLTELYLPLVIKLSKDFNDMGLTHSDLVAEGNLALYEAVLDYASLPEHSTDIKDFEQYICTCIQQALRAAVNTEIGSSRISHHLAEQINALNNASTELANDLGREATLEELCEKLSLSEDEIKELMKISIDALSVIQTDDDY